MEKNQNVHRAVTSRWDLVLKNSELVTARGVDAMRENTPVCVHKNPDCAYWKQETHSQLAHSVLPEAMSSP